MIAGGRGGSLKWVKIVLSNIKTAPISITPHFERIELLNSFISAPMVPWKDKCPTTLLHSTKIGV